MKRASALSALLVVASVVGIARAGDYPEPSRYPKAWEFTFTHAPMKRIVVNTSAGPKAYYYITYNVINNTKEERMFFPYFTLLTQDGRLIRSDKSIPAGVFQAIKQREGKRLLEPEWQIQGTLRIGEDQARDGVAIWEAPAAELGKFSVFVGGLSGETATVPGADGKSVILRKTLQLNYLVRGDEIYPGEDEINEEASRWVMR